MKKPISDQSAANQQPISGEMDAPRVPRPREQVLIAALADGTARSVADAMRIARINPSSSAIRTRLAPGGDLRIALDKAMTEAGLTLPFTLNKLKSKMDATKTVQIGMDAIPIDDNNAQLRATDMTIRLLDRAGKLPAEQEQAGGSSSITVNIMVMGDNDQS